MIETLITVGVVAIVAAGAVTVSAASRAMAVTSAAARFDALIDTARTIARENADGATIAVTPDAFGDGFIARLYRNRPGTQPLAAVNAPAVEGRVAIDEVAALGAAPFALAFHASGVIGGFVGDAASGRTGAEIPCPAGGSFHLRLSYAHAQADRLITCHVDLAATGTLRLAPQTPATAQPLPTAAPCLGSCGTPPPIPTVVATCPPRFIQTTATTCDDPPLLVSPASLTFAAPGQPASLTYAVHEDFYTGPFSVSDNCAGAISDTIITGNGNGTDSSYSVTSAAHNIQCAISVADNRGNSRNVTVAVLSTQLVPQTTCDPRSPARPPNTDIGPDPDGVHEDFSDGTSCSVSSPQPTAAPSAPPPSVALAWYTAVFIEPTTFTRCGPGRNAITQGRDFFEGVLIRATPGGLVSSTTNVARASWSNTISCAGGQNPSTTPWSVFSAATYSPITATPSAIEIQRRVQSDINYWCAAQGCPGDALWPTGLGSGGSRDLFAAFSSMATFWSAMPSPNNLIYGQRWEVTATGAETGTIVAPCATGSPECP